MNFKTSGVLQLKTNSSITVNQSCQEKDTVMLFFTPSKLTLKDAKNIRYMSSTEIRNLINTEQTPEFINGI